MAFELDPCRVHGAGGELVAAGHVHSANATSLQVTAPRYSGRALAPGDVVVLEVDSPVRGECTFDAVVGGSWPGRIDLTALSLRAVVQKRSAVRVPVAVPLLLTQLPEEPEEPEESGEQGEPEEDADDVVPEPLVGAVVIDVSADGLRFRSTQKVPAGRRLQATFPARRPVTLVLEVLRHEDVRAGVAHGCRFVDLSERDRDAMVTFVLEQERRLIAERRDSLPS